MESQPFQQQQHTSLQQSRPQSDDVNAISRTSRAERPPDFFLVITLCLGLSSWLISLVSQAVVAATINNGNAEVRLLWFGIVIQFILLLEIFEVVISRNMLAYGVQISIFAGLATVFAVLGVDQHIYTSSNAQISTGAGWLITAIIDLLWIIYFTSPSDSHFIRLLSTFSSSGPSSELGYRPKPADKVPPSQDAFVMSPPNGSSDARPGAEALIGLGLGPDEYATLAAVDIDKLKEERMRGPERTSGYDFDNIVPKRGSRTRSGGLWSNYTPSSQAGPRSSGATDVPRGGEKDTSALGSERETSVRPESNMSAAPETPTQQPPTTTTATQSTTLRMAPEVVSSAQPANEPIAQWRAEALYGYPGTADDPNELSFKKGDHLAIIDRSGKWWEAITMDGRKGIAPSNYLQLLI